MNTSGHPKYVANSLLLAAFAVYSAARLYAPFGAANPAVLATSEAALVGGIADWFAVTALFRHPLGLPIPHTAVIPSSKKRIGEALASFLGENFVNEEKLSAFIGDKVFPRLKGSIETESARREMAEKLVPFITEIAAVLKENYQSLVQDLLRPVLAELKISRIAGSLLSAALKIESASIVSKVLVVVHELLKSHEQSVMKLISSELPWYIPSFVGEKIYRDILRAVLRRIEAPSGIDDVTKYLERLAVELTVTSELSNTIDKLWHDTLINPNASSLRSLWEEVFAVISGPNSELKAHVESLLAIGSRALDTSAESQLLAKATQRATAVVVRHFSKDLLWWISDTIEHWDSKTIVAKIEERIGTDLQYIRVNGTIVGALVGLSLFLVFG